VIALRANKNSDLPAGWEVRPLGEVVRPMRPRIKPSEKPGLAFIGMENIEAHTMKLLGTVPARTMKSSAVHFQADDVLYGRLRPYLNKVYRSDFEGLCSAEFIVFPKTQGIESRYLQYFLNSPAFVSYSSHLNTGDRPRVDFDQLAPYPFPLAPYNQQQIIVAEIEKQFSRLDEAVASLRRVKANLKRYKGAVLKAAAEGKLTEEWRKQHPDVEPASKLLERILAERRAKWSGKGKYKEPVDPDTNNLGSIPNSWSWAVLEQLCPRFVDSAHRTPRYGQIGIPALGPRDVVAGKLNLKEARRVDDAEYAIQTERHVPEAGDIVYSRELSLGWGAIIPPDVRVCLSQGMCLFRPHEALHPRYFIVVLNGPHGRHQAELAATGSAHPHVNLGDIKRYSIPLPPSREQEEIVGEVERRLSVIEELEAAVESNLKRADRLRQSVLRYAFEGKL
jgi:type I restriction enzyme S subunit